MRARRARSCATAAPPRSGPNAPGARRARCLPGPSGAGGRRPRRRGRRTSSSTSTASSSSSPGSFWRHRPQGFLSGQYTPDVLDDHPRHFAPRFDRRAARVGHHDDAVVVQQRRRDRRLVLVDVQAGAGQRARLQRPREGDLVDDRAAGGVQEQALPASSSRTSRLRRGAGCLRSAGRGWTRRRNGGGARRTRRAADRRDRLRGAASGRRRSRSCRTPSPGGPRLSRCVPARRRRKPCP